MDYSVRFVQSAQTDLRNIGDYIMNELREPDTARDIVRGIIDRAETLRETPSRHELIENKVLATKGIRKQYFKNYVVFYRIVETAMEVEVIAILHMRVDTKAILLRRIK